MPFTLSFKVPVWVLSAAFIFVFQLVLGRGLVHAVAWAAVAGTVALISDAAFRWYYNRSSRKTTSLSRSSLVRTPLFLGREPAAWLSLFAILVKLVSAFGVQVSPEMQATVNAVAAAGMGILIALAVHDGLGAALIGFAQAALALGIGLGLDWSADKQAVVMTAVTIAVGMWDRTQVTAKVPKKQPLPLA